MGLLRQRRQKVHPGVPRSKDIAHIVKSNICSMENQMCCALLSWLLHVNAFFN